jgi:hypothetical protein
MSLSSFDFSSENYCCVHNIWEARCIYGVFELCTTTLALALGLLNPLLYRLALFLR